MVITDGSTCRWILGSKRDTPVRAMWNINIQHALLESRQRDVDNCSYCTVPCTLIKTFTAILGRGTAY